MLGGAGTRIVNNTIHIETFGVTPDAFGPAAVLARTTDDLAIQNNVFVIPGTAAVSVDTTDAIAVSDYNIFHYQSLLFPDGDFPLGHGLHRRYELRTRWPLGRERADRTRTASRPSTCRAARACIFVDPLGADSPETSATWLTDWHLLSTEGVYVGGTLSVVLDELEGLPRFNEQDIPTPADETSRGVDEGDPSLPIGDERTPNGSALNIGAYGGTAAGIA